MSRPTISAPDPLRAPQDAESARTYLEQKRWPNGAICPICGEAKRIHPRKDGFYRCNACLHDFTVRTGTIFEKSKVPLHKWIFAMDAFRSGISSAALARQIGVTQKTAWAMIQKMRKA